MHHFQYKKNDLNCEEVPLAKIAQEVGTPCYVYSYATLSRHYRVFDEAFEGILHLVCFAMKANSNLAILRAMVKLGAGIDIVFRQIGRLNASSSCLLQLPPRASMPSRLTVASTEAACAPPMTETRAFGHIHRKRGE